VDEDDPEKLKHAVYVLTMKLFADMERKRRAQETRDMEERKRKREEELEEAEKARLEKEWLKNYEVRNINKNKLVIDANNNNYFALDCRNPAKVELPAGKTSRQEPQSQKKRKRIKRNHRNQLRKLNYSDPLSTRQKLDKQLQ